MNAFTNYLEKLGNNFLVAAMVPSLALVVASLLMFDPILHIAGSFQTAKETSQWIGIGVIVFIVTVVIGYTLTVLNTHVLKFYEGYIVPFPFRFVYNKAQRVYRQKAKALMEQRDAIKKEYQHLRKFHNQHPVATQRLEELKDYFYEVASEYDTTYPANLDDVLPTRFGNQLRAAEDHAVQRYGFDGVTFWPRLIHVIPESYRATIDSARNEVSFLANLSILSGVFSALCIFAIIHVMWTTDVVSGNKVVFEAFMLGALRYLVAAVAGLAGFFLFYKASIVSLGSFTGTIRSAFDLFRLDLLRKLEVQRPKNFNEEFDTWQNINELIVIGNQSVTFRPFKYRPERSSSQQ